MSMSQMFRGNIYTKQQQNAVTNKILKLIPLSSLNQVIILSVANDGPTLIYLKLLQN